MQAAVQEETLYRVRYQLVMAEQQADRVAGHRTADASAALNAAIGRLEEALRNAHADSELLTDQTDKALAELGEVLGFRA